jgi:hypothetical protein
MFRDADADAKSDKYILGRVRAMLKHSDAEIEAIAASMHDLRRKFSISFQTSLESWHVKPFFVGFHGFATDFERSVFLRCIKFCIKPRVIFSSFMPNGSFEGVLVVHPISATAGVGDLEQLFELFKMSAGLTDLGTYMSPTMIACIERVEAGKLSYGNWRCMRSTCVRNAYLHAKHKRDMDLEYERVRYETGLPFSTSNMLAIHHRLNNTQIELMQASQLLSRLRTLISGLPPTFNVYGSEAIQEPSALHEQYVRNMQGLIDTLLLSFHGPAPGLRAVLIDLT